MKDGKQMKIIQQPGKGPTLATRLLSLVDGLDDTDGNGLSHITDGETTERRVLIVGLNALEQILGCLIE